MELEFDKEIDALLRQSKPRDGTPATVSAAAAAVTHLDADAISSFTENALPAPARLAYTQHLADCASCRQQLAMSIRLRPEEAAADVAAQESAAVVAAPWYRGLFRTPGLAIAFGALVIAFGGFLGYLALRDSTGANVAMMPEAAANSADRPIAEAPIDRAVANTSANTNSSGSLITEPQVGSVNASGRKTVEPSNANSGLSKERIDARPAAAAAPASSAEAGAPPPPPPVSVADSTAGESTVTVTVTASEDKKKVERNQAAELEKQQNRNRDALLATPKQRSGPMRSQNQSQSQVQNLPNLEASRKEASGRSFIKRDGAWYDTAYSGQQTIDVRRGSGEFRRLDAGLRNIANSIDGVVVALWKGKAYRIQ